jgi:alkylhydroperoxidase/carboxymuconolactone decarboxylase family protein YurZ
LTEEVAMFDEIEEIRKTRKKYNNLMFNSGIGTFRQFEDLEANALKDGALSRKHKELIALGISITQKCYG